MAALSLSLDEIRPLNRWDNCRIQPGNVGSVGDALIQTRLRNNCSDDPIRWLDGTVGKGSSWHGTHLADGQHLNDTSMGGPAILIDSNWGARRDFKTRLGWIYQDMRETDKKTIVLMGATPDYSWNNKIATNHRAMISGDKFLPVPGGYQPSPNDILRGGNFPIISSNVDNSAPPGGYTAPNPLISSGGPGGSDYAYMKAGGIVTGASKPGYKGLNP